MIWIWLCEHRGRQGNISYWRQHSILMDVIQGRSESSEHEGKWTDWRSISLDPKIRTLQEYATSR